MNDFLPQEYNVPQASSNYMKFKEGENKFRILTSPILGWLTWTEFPDGSRKPHRNPLDKPFTIEEAEDGDPNKIKHFWAMVVWNYQEEKIQILEITQKGIQKSLRALAKSKDWGSPLEYDVLVTKTGQKLETEYQVNPIPPKPLTKDIKEEFDKTLVDLSALYRGDDPFKKSQGDVNINDIPADL